MPINNPSGGNPQSGTVTGQGSIEKAVRFAVEFATKPNVVLTPWGNYHIWLTTITTGGFKVQNDSDEDVKVDWIADQS